LEDLPLNKSLPVESQNDVPSLLGQDKSGNEYRRTKEVERQIRSSLALSDNEIIANANITDQHADNYLREEALVFLIRQSYQEQNQFLYDELFMILLGRCKEQISYRLRSLEVSLKEDALSEVNAKLIENVLRDDGKGDFLEVRFWVVLNRLAIDVFRQFIHSDNDDHEYLEAEAFSEYDPIQQDEKDTILDLNQLVPGEQRWSLVEKGNLVEDALQSLSPHIRQAFILFYYLDWPIDSKDEKLPTISKYFGKTGKTIQNWLYEAKESIEKWRGDHYE